MTTNHRTFAAVQFLILLFVLLLSSFTFRLWNSKERLTDLHQQLQKNQLSKDRQITQHLTLLDLDIETLTPRNADSLLRVVQSLIDEDTWLADKYPVKRKKELQFVHDLQLKISNMEKQLYGYRHNSPSLLQKKVQELKRENTKLKSKLSDLQMERAHQNVEIIQLNDQVSERSNRSNLSFSTPKGDQVYYLGSVSESMANGKGIGVWSTGGVYKGMWKNNHRHGKGVYEWKDGEKYDGFYVDDQRTGEGTYFFKSGERYEGEWKRNRREGKGILFDINGNILFEGQWKNDKPVK